MSLYGKFSLGLVFLLVAGSQLRAQWPNDPRIGSLPGSECRNISLMVTDSGGSAIMGAAVATDNGFQQLFTDSQGIADIPCRAVDHMMPTVTVTASGYQPTKVTLTPDARSRFEVRLDRSAGVPKSSSSTVNVSELSVNVQKKSDRLQQQAQSALSTKDYDQAEKLFLQAFQLTPSSPSISNNLGVVALGRHDLESAANWFQKASELAPHKSDIVGNLGLVRWMQHRFKESYELLAKATAQGYESNLGNYILGTVGLEMGNSQDAVEYLKKISSERFPYRDLYLSIALRNCGKTKAADESFQSFLRRNPAPYVYLSLN